ncbi:MAG: class I SAM-dependent methyltransferase [Thermoplasmatota archaeon]
MGRGDEIRKGVRDTYDRIAPHFARRRGSLWPPMEEFLGSVSPCVIGDLGCGTGRVVRRALDLGCEVFAVDSSQGQLDQARGSVEGPEMMGRVRFIRADLGSVPIDDGTLDNAMMIASLHHLPDRGSRIEALREALRILRPKGLLQISVWTWDQERFRDRHLSRIDGKREPDETDGPLHGDFYVPWKEGEVGYRFYHLYGPGELEEEIAGSGLILIRSYFDGRNHWCECSAPRQ